MIDLAEIFTSLTAWRSPVMIGIVVGAAAALYGAASQLNKRTIDALDKISIQADVLARGVLRALTNRIDAHERHGNTMFVVNAILGTGSLVSGLAVGLGKLASATPGLAWVACAWSMLFLGVGSLIYAERFRRRVRSSIRELEDAMRRLVAASAEQKAMSEALSELLQSQPKTALERT